MKEYSIEKIVNAILSLQRLHKLSNFATAKVGKDVRVLTNPGNQCYSSDDWYSGTCITLGTNFYSSSFNDTKNVTSVDLKDKYKRIALIMFGVYYHELFHLLYTPFGLAGRLTDNCNQYFKQFVHTICNILEDVTIEETGMNRYPFSEQYVMSVREVFHLPDQEDMLKNAIENEPDNPGTLVAYLLRFCRECDLSNLPKYSLWEDNKEFLVWGAYKCINTIDATTRVKRQIAYALQLIKILDMKEPSKDDVENPDLSDLDSQSSSFNKSMSGSGLSSMDKTINNMMDTSIDNRYNAPRTEPQDTDSDIKEPDKAKEQKAQHNQSSGEGIDDPGTSDLTKEGITMLANDQPAFGCSHYADKLNKYMKTDQHMPDYLRIVREYEAQIRQVVATIRKMQATNNASWNHYKMKGRLDSSTFYKKDNYKIFKKKNAPAPQADLVFEILVDNSGSMYGTKAKLAGQALIIFCEALDRLHIPFSIDAFTEGRHAITISLKDYNESYAKTKTNMILFTKQIDVNKLCTWSGNVDEVNLKYVSEVLLERKEKDKVLIVISDGATCGDWKVLKKVADDISVRGVTMLGVGVYDNNVSKIYKNNIILRDQKDLEGLSAFLNKYLIGKIFNK